MRGFGQLLGDRAIHARHGHAETRSQKKGVAGAVEIDLGIDFRAAGQLDLPLGGGELDRAHVAGRPGGGEQVLGGRMRLRELQIDKAVAAAGEPSRPLLLWVLPVKRTLAVVVMLASLSMWQS